MAHYDCEYCGEQRSFDCCFQSKIEHDMNDISQQARRAAQEIILTRYSEELKIEMDKNTYRIIKEYMKKWYAAGNRYSKSG